MTDEAEILDEKYQVVRQIGVGGMGEVLLATHLQLDQQVAIKLLKKELSTDTIAVERFLREARAAARIQSDHVVRVFDVATMPDGRPYIVMEYLEGEDLAHRLDNGPLAAAEAVDYVLQACVAIAEAHRVGVIHRDLKPGNLFLTRRRDGSAMLKVVDFGISKMSSKAGRVEAALTTTSHMMGSPFYMSPEQLKGADVDVRTDVWALGLILFELLTAEGPFDAPTMPQMCMQIMSGPARSLSDVRPDIEFPAGLETIIERCLEKDVEARYADVVDLAAALAPFAPGSAFGTTRTPSNMPTKPPAAKGGTLPLAKADIAARAAPNKAATPMQDDGGKVTSSAWDTGNVGSKTKKKMALLLGVAAVCFVIVVVAAVRLVTNRDAGANATSAPRESLPPPPVPTASVVVSAPSASVSADAPVASGAPVPSVKPRPTGATAPVKPTGGGTDEFGGRK
jgi:serine/threonine-protein kinase